MTRSKTAALAGMFLILMAVALCAWTGVAQAQVIERASVTTGGKQGGGSSGAPSISADGRYVALVSDAADLVPEDTNGVADVFVRDREGGVTERVSVAADGTQADGPSGAPSISADGRYVAFTSTATNLVPGDTNSCADVFVRDRQTGLTLRVSVHSDGTQADGKSRYPSISADGRFVAFASYATGLVPGDTNGGADPTVYGLDVFVYDRETGTTERVSVASDGTQGDTGGGSNPSISADGRFVAFESWAAELVPGGSVTVQDILVHDRQTGTTEQVSFAATLGEGARLYRGSRAPSISAAGRYVAFNAEGFLVAGLIDLHGDAPCYVYDRQTATTEQVNLGDDLLPSGVSGGCSISADGRLVAFSAAVGWGDPYEHHDYGVFVRDRQAGSTAAMSASLDGWAADSGCYAASISADGRFVAFESDATNLVPGDTNSCDDVFVSLNADWGICTFLRGSDRYFTALLLSQAAFPDPLPAGSGLVLAPGTTFPEALCGAPLAAAYGGPVLLTPTTGLHNDVKAELQRLQPDYVFVIGLSTTIRNNVQTALPGATVTAIGGATIYQMSRNVAAALGARVNASGGDISQAVGLVTIGTKFVDALGLGPLACAKKWPIILTDSAAYGSALHAEALGTFTDLGITQMLKVGTYCAVPAGITGLGNLSGSTPPGVNSALARYYTNANVAQWAATEAGLAFAHLGIATGDKFPDALAAGPYLAKDGGVLLLSPLVGPLPAPVAAVITAHAGEVERVSYLAMIEPVLSQVRVLLP